MRTKDLDEVLPNVAVQVDETTITIDGSRTTMVNGTVTQNGLELILRMERVAKALATAAAQARENVQQAIASGVPVQDGNRVGRIDQKASNISWKSEFEALLKAQGLDKKEIKARCEALGYKSQVEQLLDTDDFEAWETEKKEAQPKKDVLTIE